MNVGEMDVLSKLNPFKALVIGDFMLDTYTTGKVRRISPEAPVPILHVEKQESRPGGAGNVVLNLISLGAEVTAIGRIGADLDGKNLKAALENENANTEFFLVQKEYKTSVKNRLIAGGQQILRVDNETITQLPSELERLVITKILTSLNDVQVIALSDYGKGFLSNSLISAIVEIAKTRKIPLIVDPKGNDFRKYKGATIIKPNIQEAYIASKFSEAEPLQKVAEVILEETQVQTLLITRSEAGISIFEKGIPERSFPVQAKEVKDVTGAGDTVLAILSCALANELSIDQAAALANIAASIAIEKLGCARVSLKDLANRMLDLSSSQANIS